MESIKSNKTIKTMKTMKVLSVSVLRLHRCLPKHLSSAYFAIIFSLLLFTGCVGGKSPLFNAIRHNDVGEVKRVIAQGANVNEISKASMISPLYFSLSKDRIEIVKLLLDNGANVNIGQLNIYNYSNEGWTPLQFASIRKMTEIVKLLLDKNPNIDVVNPYRNQTALDMAIQKNATEIVNLIREARTKQMGINAPERPYNSFTTLDLINTVSSGAINNKENTTTSSGTTTQPKSITTSSSTDMQNSKEYKEYQQKEASKVIEQEKKHSDNEYKRYLKQAKIEKDEADYYLRQANNTSVAKDRKEALDKSNSCLTRYKEYLEKAEIYKPK